MSYARFGWNGSDVYVYLDVGGYLHCCGCLLSGSAMGEDYHKLTAFYTTDDMLAHLEKHREVGHTVPQDCIDSLLEDKEENDEWLKNYGGLET